MRGVLHNGWQNNYIAIEAISTKFTNGLPSTQSCYNILRGFFKLICLFIILKKEILSVKLYNFFAIILKIAIFVV